MIRIKKRGFLTIFLCKCYFFTFSIEANTSNFIEPSNSQTLNQCYVTPGFWPGRFGDQLLLLLKNYWVSYKYQIPFVPNKNQPFKRLFLDQISSNLPNNLPHIVCKSEDEIKKIDTPSIIYIDYSFKDDTWNSPVQIHDWKNLRTNRDFLTKFRKLTGLQNSTDCLLISPNKDITSIALHIRFWEKGYNLKSIQIIDDTQKNYTFHPYEEKSIDFYFPLKFPPLQFYIDQLNYITALEPKGSYYVFLFTDYPDPEKIANAINDHLENKDAFHFDWRRNESESNDELTRTYEDFYSLLNFDYLIRPGESNFSQMTQILKDYKYAIFPSKYVWNNGFLQMTNIQIEKDGSLFEIL